MIRDRPASLRTVLVLFALCIILPTTLAIGGMVAWNVMQVRRSHEAELLATARSASKAVDIKMVQLKTAADALATSEPVIAQNWGAARRRIERLGLPSDSWVAVSDQAGRRLLNTSPLAGPAPPPRLPRPAGVQAALRSGRAVISDLFVGASTGQQVVAIDRAVPGDPNQKVVSLIVAPRRLLPSADELALPAGAIITIVDRSQHVIARSSGHERFQGVSATPHMKAILNRRVEDVAASRSLDGRPTVVAYSRSDLTGWTTMVVVPEGTVLQPVLRNAGAFVLLAAILLLLGIGLSRIFGNVLIRELRALEEDAVRLGHGQKVERRPGRIENVETVQSALSEASAELRQRASRQELMINELNHRVKNTLATVQGIAVQTFRQADPDAPAKFDHRLVALAAAHDLLTKTSWEPVDIRSVAEGCLEASGGDLVFTGPSILLPPHAALALCMCLHELVTNSLKYGALSSPGGKVFMSWTLTDEGEIDFLWREQGGPPVRTPERRGFGSRLVDRLVKTELGGHVEREFAPEGLVITGRFVLPDSERWRNSF
ncbi:sensor histidine kinase [Brevundimonas alba]|nr:sensor histidine kinase [Brevundimonas alba]